MIVEAIYALPVDADGWRVLPRSGNRVKLGNGVMLGNRVTLGDGVTLKRTPCQVQCDPYPVYLFSPTHLGVGCVIHPLAYWTSGQVPAELAGHPECLPWDKYQAAINLVLTAIDAFEKEEKA